EVVVLRVGSAELGIDDKSKRDLGVEELSQVTTGNERNRVNGTRIKRVEGIGDRVEAGTERGVVEIDSVTKGRLTAKLEVQGAVFDVVKDAEASTHDQLGIAEHVPGKTQPGSDVISIGRDQPATGGSGITGIEHAGRRLGKYGGLMAREKS